ncbi:MAG: phosphoribosylaminoimidazolesuccinocarboxamide synthase [Acidimicrobiales bacterium]
MRLLASGKVRELYEVRSGLLVMVASDRISAFDVVFEEEIPQKGRVLTATSAYWYQETSSIARNSFVSADPEDVAREVGDEPWAQAHSGCAMIVQAAQMLPLECIVRSRLAGSAAAEYERNGTVHGLEMPAGLVLGDPLPEPLFTPSTKAASGHDVNIDFRGAAELVGAQLVAQAREICLALFEAASHQLSRAGLVLADTKFELGLLEGSLVLCDEVVTPDSSRIWAADALHRGTPPPSFDKQPLRDWAMQSGWDGSPPPPRLPAPVVEATSRRYVESYERMTGRFLDDWYGPAPVTEATQD